VIISTTVDQATQAQRMIRDMGGPIGIRSALAVGSQGEIEEELRLLRSSMPHILCGTPQKLHMLFMSNGGLSGGEVRFLVLDEVDQLLARNVADFVYDIVRLFPPPRSRSVQTPGSMSNPLNQGGFSPFDQASNRRASGLNQFDGSSASALQTPVLSATAPAERQTALFSNTVPQDVLNLASTIQLREPVRVLVRRDGNTAQTETNTSTRGLRQFYLYLAFTAGGSRVDAPNTPGGGHGIIGSGRGATNAETTQAREWKLDALADLFSDIEITHAIVHVGGFTSLDAVTYKLAGRGMEVFPLHSEMNPSTKMAALNKFRGNNSMLRQPTTKILVVYDVQVKAPDVFQVPLVINYDLPKAVEEYAHRVAPAISTSWSRAGVVVNFVTATGGDVEMLRSIECYYKIKCPEVPLTLRDVL
jgi:translation initiation factor 4A